MKEVTIEELFEIRNRLLSTVGKYSPKVNVMLNILNGSYDNTAENPIHEAYNDLYFLTSTKNPKVLLPSVGQVYKIKEKYKRSFRENKLTINYVKIDGVNNYFTFEEQQDVESCWTIDYLELYELVG
jgi:hypothetical protein